MCRIGRMGQERVSRGGKRDGAWFLTPFHRQPVSPVMHFSTVGAQQVELNAPVLG